MVCMINLKNLKKDEMDTQNGQEQTIKSLSTRFATFASQTILFETGGEKAGAYHKDPADKGGETKWGISKQAHPEIDIENLTYRHALTIYENQYWNPFYDYIYVEKLAFKLYDMGVLMGKHRAIKTLQKAIKKNRVTIKVDGIFGPMTLTGSNTIEAQILLYETYIYLLNRYFKRISLYGKNKKFLRGWLKRLYWVWSTDGTKEGINEQ